VHRIGRTARAGAEGVAISLCDAEEAAYLRDIEKLIRMSLPVVDKRSHSGRDEAQNGKQNNRQNGRPARSHAPGQHPPGSHGKSSRGNGGRGHNSNGKGGARSGGRSEERSQGRSQSQSQDRHWHRGDKPRSQAHQGQPQQARSAQGQANNHQAHRGHSNHEQPRDIASVAFLHAGGPAERN
jgi:ATP-dependent RNA helicase RhlE